MSFFPRCMVFPDYVADTMAFFADGHAWQVSPNAAVLQPVG